MLTFKALLRWNSDERCYKSTKIVCLDLNWFIRNRLLCDGKHILRVWNVINFVLRLQCHSPKYHKDKLASVFVLFGQLRKLTHRITWLSPVHLSVSLSVIYACLVVHLSVTGVVVGCFSGWHMCCLEQSCWSIDNLNRCFLESYNCYMSVCHSFLLQQVTDVLLGTLLLKYGSFKPIFSKML